MRRSPVVALLAILAVLAACSEQTASPSAEASVSAEPTATATASPTTEATEEAPPSLEEGAGELADVLPDEVGGISIQYQSSSGEAVLGSEGMTSEAREVFDRLGAEPSDLSSAFGFGVDQAAGNVITIVAFRVAGADEGQLRDEFRASLEQEGNVATEETLGGKDVLAFGTEGTDTPGYVYVSGDTIFIVAGQPSTLAEEALTDLP
jgi:hypothetical protein